jgi:hypothetical protein
MLNVGDKVVMDGRSGKVVACRNAGMYDIQFSDVAHIERRSGDRLMRTNPRDAETFDADKDQFRAVVQGVYESLVRKHKGVKYNEEFLGSRGGRLDASLSAATKRQLLSRAFAIATRQGQKHGWLHPGTQLPTVKGVLASQVRHLDTDSTTSARYEGTLERVRKHPKEPTMRYKMNSRLHGQAVQEGKAKRHSGFKAPGGIPIKGVKYGMGSVRGRGPLFAERMETNVTPTMLFAVPPVQDPDLVGYFILVYDPQAARGRRKTGGEWRTYDRFADVLADDRVKRAGWVVARNISANEIAMNTLRAVEGPGGTIKRTASPTHVVRMVRATDGSPRFAVIPAASKKGDVYTTREAAEARAEQLNIQNAASAVPFYHSVVPVQDEGEPGYRVVGPRADSIGRTARSRSTGREEFIEGNFFETAEEAVRVARALDRRHSQSGAPPIKGIRTRERMGAREAVRALEVLRAVLAEHRIPLRRDVTTNEVNTILSGPPSDAPTPAFLHLTLDEVRAKLLERYPAAAVEQFIQEEAERRNRYASLRMRTELTRGSLPRASSRDRVPAEELEASEVQEQTGRARRTRANGRFGRMGVIPF